MRWIGYVVVGIIALTAAAYGALYGFTEYRFARTFDVPRVAVALSGAERSAERGSHIAVIRGCVDCHSDDLGGRVFLDVPPVGYLYAANLTSGEGGIGRYTDEDLAAAIRHGVGPDGRALWFMPAQEFNVMSDRDVADLIAYIRTLPPIDRTSPRSRIGPLGRLLYATGELPLIPAEMIDHRRPRPEAPAETATVEYGAYLATGCMGCHGSDFGGGPIPGTPPGFPPASNLTPHESTGIGGWNRDDFERALRTGVRPDGRALRPEMPWRLTAQLHAHELEALWLYFRSLPPVDRKI